MGVGTDSVLIFPLALVLGGGSEVEPVLGPLQCRLIHACRFFHDRITCMHGLVVGLTVK